MLWKAKSAEPDWTVGSQPALLISTTSERRLDVNVHFNFSTHTLDGTVKGVELSLSPYLRNIRLRHLICRFCHFLHLPLKAQRLTSGQEQ
jgi:hypothetical protein